MSAVSWCKTYVMCPFIRWYVFIYYILKSCTLRYFRTSQLKVVEESLILNWIDQFFLSQINQLVVSPHWVIKLFETCSITVFTLKSENKKLHWLHYNYYSPVSWMGTTRVNKGSSFPSKLVLNFHDFLIFSFLCFFCFVFIHPVSSHPLLSFLKTLSYAPGSVPPK